MEHQINTAHSFEIFFREHHAAVLRYCFTMVMDMDNAKDIVQQCFVSIWQAAGTGDIQGSAKPYLYRAVYNASLNFLKHESVKDRYAKKVARQSPVYAVQGDENTLRKKIDEAIAQLPEQCRKIFIMSRVEGMKYKEIAASLGISEKTVENQVGKALKILRTGLREYIPLLFILSQVWHG